MSSGSLAALPASDENEEAAVEGREQGWRPRPGAPRWCAMALRLWLARGPSDVPGQRGLREGRCGFMAGVTSPWGYLGEGEPLGPGAAQSHRAPSPQAAQGCWLLCWPGAGAG